VAEGVYPVTPPGEEAVNLNETFPLVNVLGLCNLIFVRLLSHWIVSAGTGKSLGIGFTDIVNTISDPSQVCSPNVKCGMTVIFAVTKLSLSFSAINCGMFPVPAPGSPIEG
jgi:hypothetical protein